MQQNRLDALSRQVQEVAALQSVYPDDGSLAFSPEEQQRLRHAEEVTSDPESCRGTEDVWAKCLSGCVNLPGIRVQGAAVTLSFMLPMTYPDVSPSLQLIANVPREHLDQLNQELTSFAAQHVGEEVLLLCTDHITTRLESHLESGALTAAAPSTSLLPTTDEPQSHILMHAVVWCAALTRCPMWCCTHEQEFEERPCRFHHIQSPKKRRSMAAWSADLSVGGMYKIGYPGVLMLEGAVADVAEYLARLRSQRWKAMAVRGERHEECSSADALRQRRRLPTRLVELQAEQLGEMGDACHAAGLRDLFLCALKLESD